MAKPEAYKRGAISLWRRPERELPVSLLCGSRIVRQNAHMPKISLKDNIMYYSLRIFMTARNNKNQGAESDSGFDELYKKFPSMNDLVDFLDQHYGKVDWRKSVTGKNRKIVYMENKDPQHPKKQGFAVSFTNSDISHSSPTWWQTDWVMIDAVEERCAGIDLIRFIDRDLPKAKKAESMPPVEYAANHFRLWSNGGGCTSLYYWAEQILGADYIEANGGPSDKSTIDEVAEYLLANEPGYGCELVYSEIVEDMVGAFREQAVLEKEHKSKK